MDVNFCVLSFDLSEANGNWPLIFRQTDKNLFFVLFLVHSQMTEQIRIIFELIGD